jgi:hypothetical protein
MSKEPHMLKRSLHLESVVHGRGEGVGHSAARTTLESFRLGLIPIAVRLEVWPIKRANVRSREPSTTARRATRE